MLVCVRFLTPNCSKSEFKKCFGDVWIFLWKESEGPLFDFWLNLLDEKELGPKGWPGRQVNPGTVGTAASGERIPPVSFCHKNRPDWLIQPEWQAQDSTMCQTSTEHLYTFVRSLCWKRFPDPSEHYRTFLNSYKCDMTSYDSAVLATKTSNHQQTMDLLDLFNQVTFRRWPSRERFPAQPF